MTDEMTVVRIDVMTDAVEVALARQDQLTAQLLQKSKHLSTINS